MNALILASADCLPADLRDFVEILGGRRWAHVVIAVGAAGVFYGGRIDHWVVLHADELPDLRELRARHGGRYRNADYVTWTREGQPYAANADRTAPHWKGSSGLLAVSVAFTLGAERIVLCGLPLDARPHLGSKDPWHASANFRKDWLIRRALLSPRIRSMNGWTEETFGRPTEEWLGLPEQQRSA